MALDCKPWIHSMASEPLQTRMDDLKEVCFLQFCPQTKATCSMTIQSFDKQEADQIQREIRVVTCLFKYISALLKLQILFSGF